MQNIEETILSQYANSPTLMALINSANAAIDPTANINAFYQLMWSIDSAQGYGLDVWGRIVGVSRILHIPVTNTADLGFKEAGGKYIEPFQTAPFSSGTNATQNFVLSDVNFRILILVKALSNISNCSIETYNRLLMELFPGRGNAYVGDGLNMTGVLFFTFQLTAVELAIIQQSGAIIAPTGVGFRVADYQFPIFGFEEAGVYSSGFNQGVF